MLEDECYQIIGQRIRVFRLQKQMTQLYLGEKLRISRSSVANIEAGRQRIQVHFLFQIATELETSLIELLDYSWLSL